MRKLVLIVPSVSLFFFYSCNSKKETVSSVALSKTESPEEPLVTVKDIRKTKNVSKTIIHYIKNNISN